MSTEPVGPAHAKAPEVPWVPDDSSFGARLALVRWRMAWNMKEGALACGVPAASWRLWEQGAMPRNLIDIARRISTRTGCDYGWLIGGSELAGRRGVQTKDGTLTPPVRPPDNRPNGRPDRGVSGPSDTRPATRPDRGVTPPGSPRRTRRLALREQVPTPRRAA